MRQMLQILDKDVNQTCHNIMDNVNMDLQQRLKSAAKKANIKQIQIAQHLGVSRAAVSRWFSGDAKNISGENLTGTANLLGVNPHWLATGKGGLGLVSEHHAHYNISAGPDIKNAVPLISSIQAGQWSDHPDKFDLNDAEELRETTAKVSGNSFALRVIGDSMTSPHGRSIPDGMIVIVDPAVSPENGSIVVAKIDHTDEATLKKLVIDGGQRYLMPLNPQYPRIDINGDCRIVGVVVKGEIDF